MSPRPPKNVVAITPGGNITLDHIIGFYSLFTIPNQPVSASKLNRLWISEGLPPHLIPRERESKHNFMAACRSIETRSRTTDANTNRRKEIEVDPVTENATRVVYQVTALVRDKLNEVIEHPKAMRVVFDKATEKIDSMPLDKNTGLDDEDLKTLAARIQEFFDGHTTKVPGERVRAGVRKLMDELGATNVRRKAGGVYFVPKDGKSSLDGLANVFEGLWGEDAELHLIFAANAEGERELVERRFNVNVSEAIEDMMARVKEALTGGEEGQRKMRKDAVGNLLQQRKVLGENRERYSELLGTELEEAGEKLDLLDLQLEQLVVNSNVD